MSNRSSNRSIQSKELKDNPWNPGTGYPRCRICSLYFRQLVESRSRWPLQPRYASGTFLHHCTTESTEPILPTRPRPRPHNGLNSHQGCTATLRKGISESRYPHLRLELIEEFGCAS